jgi:hypothetical protein
MRHLLSALCIASLLAPAAHGGVIIKTLERDAASGKEESTTLLSVENGKLLVENLEPGATKPDDAVIFKDDALIAVDHGRKSYTVMDRATLQNMAGTVDKAMKELEEKMASMSPEQRAMVEKMMGKSAPGSAKPKIPLQFKNTGKREKVGKYECALWQAEIEGQVRWQHCVVPFNQVQGGEEMLAVLKKMSTMMEDIIRSTNATWLTDAMDAGWEGIRSIDGYPVLTRSFDEGKPETETVYVSSQKTTIAAANFEPPAGYKQQQLGPN